MLSENRGIELVEQSFEQIKPQAEAFAASFYENLFAAYPETKRLFAKTDMVKQEKKLLNSLVLLVESLRKPEILQQILSDLGARHKKYGVIAKYYPLVGEVLLQTFADYLQQDWTEEVKQAWVETYQTVTTIMLEGAGVDASIQPEIPSIASTFQAMKSDQAMTSMLSENRGIELVEQSFEQIKPQAEAFAASFYENLFAAYPETKRLFAKIDMVKQEKKLLNSLVLLVESLRKQKSYSKFFLT